MKHYTKWAMTVMAILSLATVPLLFVTAIWTVGDNASRWGWTGFLFLFIGAITTMGAAIAWDEDW